MDNKKYKVLVTNGRSPMTLDLVRKLGGAGHKIHVAETSYFHFCRFSNCVTRSHVIPSPRFSSKLFIEAMVRIVETENINVLIPAWEDVLLISQNKHLFPECCQIFSSDFSLLSQLHNKWGFMKLLESIDMPAPKAMLIETKECLKKVSLKQFALKACYSRSSQKVYKLSKQDQLPIIDCSQENPWVAQEWLEGESFCTFSICKNGALTAHSTYPIDFVQPRGSNILGSIQGYCLTFRPVHHEKIIAWVTEFAKKTNFTGLLAFDFIEKETGELFAIECNPRITSGVTLFTEKDRIDHAFFEVGCSLIIPQSQTKKQITLATLLYGRHAAYRGKTNQSYWKNFLQFRDIVFHAKDLKPFLIQPVLGVKYFFQGWKLGLKALDAFTHDLDYNGESASPRNLVSSDSGLYP